MIPATNEEQLSKWLNAFYLEVDKSKLDNVTKIAAIMISDQKVLDAKLKAKHSKGLSYAAELCGEDLSKRKHSQEGEGSKRKIAKMVGAKRYIAPMPKAREPEPRKVEKSRSLPPQRPREPYPAPVARAAPSSSSSGSSKKDIYALNDGDAHSLMYLHTFAHIVKTFLLQDQKLFLKRAREDNMELRYEQNNPKNVKGASYDRYEAYKAGRTIAEALKLGAKSADISYDYSRGFITFPGGGVYAKFASMDDEAPPKPQRQKMESSHKQSQPQNQQQSQPREKVIANKSSQSAFAITDEDMKEAVEIEREVIDYSLPGGDVLKLVEKSYAEGDMEACLQHFQTELVDDTEGDMISSEMKRFRGLVLFQTLHPVKSSILKGNPREGERRSIQFADNLPTLHEAPTRDLARETRQENNLRHEPRGVMSLFDARLREMLDELFNIVSSPPPSVSDEPELMKVSFDMKDNTETFKLHKRSPMPSSAKLGDSEVRYKGCDVEGMVELLTTAQGGEKIGAKEWAGVDKYGKFGLTPLTIAARLGRDDLVEELLKLGADALNAIDGATYLSERTRDLRWIVGLLRSLHTLPALIAPDLFLKLAQHTRKKGDTPLLVAVNNKDVEAARQLLEWGASVEAPGQQRSSDQASCLDVAREKNMPEMLELLGEYTEKAGSTIERERATL